MQQTCNGCYSGCEDNGDPGIHNQNGCMGCGCEQPWGEEVPEDED